MNSVVEFLILLYCILSWYVMATFAFAPIDRAYTGKATVAFNTPYPDETLARNRRLWLGYLLLAPLIWLLMAVVYIVMSVGEVVEEAKNKDSIARSSR